MTIKKAEAIKSLRVAAAFLRKDTVPDGIEDFLEQIADLLESHAVVPRDMPATVAMVEAWEAARATEADHAWARQNIPTEGLDDRDADNLLHEAASARADYRALVAQAEKEMENA